MLAVARDVRIDAGRRIGPPFAGGLERLPCMFAGPAAAMHRWSRDEPVRVDVPGSGRPVGEEDVIHDSLAIR